MSEAGDRPRPQYGEYATPEEQRARIRQPDASSALEAGQTPDGAEQASLGVHGAATGGHAPHSGYAVPPHPGGYAPAQAAPSGARRTGDRIATFALLGYGLFNVVTTLSALLDFPRLAGTYFSLMGIPGSFTNVESGMLWSRIALVLLVAGYAATVLVSLRRLRAGKLTWWIPLSAGVVVQLIVGVLLAVPLINDPAFQSFMMSGAV